MFTIKKQYLPTLPDEAIISKIYLIRGQKVMIDRDLAELFGPATKVLKLAVKRNINRFPIDFMFEMTEKEFQNRRSQFVTSKSDIIGLRYSPFCFTEQGVTMLSCVLNSVLNSLPKKCFIFVQFHIIFHFLAVLKTFDTPFNLYLVIGFSDFINGCMLLICCSCSRIAPDNARVTGGYFKAKRTNVLLSLADKSRRMTNFFDVFDSIKYLN